LGTKYFQYGVESVLSLTLRSAVFVVSLLCI
jgi:hypothetical protein